MDTSELDASELDANALDANALDATALDVPGLDAGPTDDAPAPTDGGPRPSVHPPIALGINQVHLLVREDGTLWARGRHDSGQLGDGSPACLCTGLVLTNVPVSGLTDVVAVESMIITSVALLGDGTVWVWGSSGGRGGASRTGSLFGDGTEGNRLVPAPVVGVSGVQHIVARGGHIFALRDTGTVLAWGDPGAGVLGSTSDGNVPTEIVGLTEAVALDTAGAHGIALRRDGTVFTWGNNHFGQAGDGTRTPGLTVAGPSGIVPGLSDVVAVASLGDANFAVRTDGTVWAWGDNELGGLGFAPAEPFEKILSPRQIPTLSGITALSAGDFHIIALRNDGTVWTWGDGELPRQVPGLGGITRIRAGGGTAYFAYQGPDVLWGWGAGWFDLGSSMMPPDFMTPVLSDAFFP